ncbi:MAG: sulfotransferase [Chloroflexota bacterium]|nr:sulfotransferase [Chloroflexota bacterium]
MTAAPFRPSTDTGLHRGPEPDARSLAVPAPSFFIVGAPGCGTTFMHEHLRADPGIFMPDLKEPSYFCTDLDLGTPADGLIFTRDLEAYLALFRPATKAQIAGEASPFYLYSTDAAGRIAAFRPEARIIIMLRDPADMIRYLHARRYFVGSEDIERFEDALAVEPARKRGERLPPDVWNVKGLYYREVGRYAEQVERYLAVFPPEQVKVIIFEEFRKDAAGTYRDVLKFLGVEASHDLRLERVNPSLGVRSRRLHRFLLTPALRKGFRRFAPAPLRSAVRSVITRVNATPRRPDFDPVVRAALHAEFRPDVERLSTLIDRDLTLIWLQQDGHAQRPSPPRS